MAFLTGAVVVELGRVLAVSLVLAHYRAEGFVDDFALPSAVAADVCVGDNGPLPCAD